MAVLFYRLFRTVDAIGAGSIAAFGFMNAVAVLGSAAMLATALDLATNPVGDAAVVQTLYLISENFWSVGNLFFGLWLIPMGTCVLTSKWMPRPLGWILVAGGVGYVLSGFLPVLAPNAQIVGSLLVLPATIGEFWMIGYLLTIGVRRRPATAPAASASAASPVASPLASPVASPLASPVASPLASPVESPGVID